MAKSTPTRMSARTVETARAGLHRDLGAVGLYLQVAQRKGGDLGKSWLYRFESPVTRKARWFGLGPWPLISLAAARDLADEARRQVRLGRDPIEQKKEQRAAATRDAAKYFSFKQCAEEYIDLHRDQWRNAKHEWQWARVLEMFAYPVFGDQPVAAVDKHLIEKALRPLWDAKKYETLVRTQRRIISILDWSVGKDRRPPDQLSKHKFFPVPSKRKRVKHHPALPFEEISAFAADLRARKGTAPRALEFLLLTSVRSGSVRNAKWPEMDLQKKIWEIPGAHTKSGRPHRVPLNDRAVAILKEMKCIDGNDHVFPGARENVLTDTALAKVMKSLRPGFVPHGLRSSFKDWATELSHHSNIVSEAALEHVIENSVEGAYRRGDLFMKRVALMNDWCRYLATKPASAKVIPLSKRNAATSGTN